MFKKLALAFLGIVVVVNVAIAVIALTSTGDRDLSLADTAVDYQRAVFGGNYEAMWDLSAPELRGSQTREEFITGARENAPTPARLLDWTVLNEINEDVARVHTRIQLTGSGIQTHRMTLRRIEGSWMVTSYAPYEGPWPPNEPPLSAS